MKFFASQRLEIRKGEKVTLDKEQIGYIAKIKTVKNKIFAPFKKVELPVLWNQGYDSYADIVESANILNLVTRAGAFYTVGDQKIQGKEKFMQLLQEDDKLKASLEKNIQEKIKEMRVGKKVLDDTALDALQAPQNTEESDAEDA